MEPIPDSELIAVHTYLKYKVIGIFGKSMQIIQGDTRPECHRILTTRVSVPGRNHIRAVTYIEYENVVAAIDSQIVITGAASQYVIATTASQSVVPGAAIEYVITCAAIDSVISGAS